MMAESKAPPPTTEIITILEVKDDVIKRRDTGEESPVIKVTDQHGRVLSRFGNDAHAEELDALRGMIGKNVLAKVSQPLGLYPRMQEFPLPTEKAVTPPVGESAQAKGGKGGASRGGGGRGGGGKSPDEMHCTLWNTCLMSARELVCEWAKMHIAYNKEMPSIVEMRKQMIVSATMAYNSGSNILPSVGRSLPAVASANETPPEPKQMNLATPDEDEAAPDEERKDGIPF
jgi:hypothetical protein